MNDLLTLGWIAISIQLFVLFMQIITSMNRFFVFNILFMLIALVAFLVDIKR